MGLAWSTAGLRAVRCECVPLKNDSNIDDMLTQEVGHALAGVANPKEGVDPFAQPESMGNFAGPVSGMLRLLRPKTKDIINAKKARGVAPDAPTREKLESILAEIEAEEAAGKVSDRNATPEGVSADGNAPEGGGPEAPLRPPQSPLDTEGIDTGKLLQDYAEGATPEGKYGEESGLNVTRHHEGASANPQLDEMAPEDALEKMRTADDVARLLEAVGKQTEKRGVRGHAEIKAATETVDQIREQLSDVFTGKQVGLMTDVQLMAARRMLTTLGQDVAAIGDRIAKGDTTSDTLMSYQRKGESLVAVQRFLQGQVTEVARALGQQRAIAQTLRVGNAEDMASLIANEGGTPAEIIKHAKVLASEARDNKKRTERKAAEMTAKMKKKGATDQEIERAVNALKSNEELRTMRKTWDTRYRQGIGLAVEYWKAQILSGIETHVVNTTSNAAVNAWENVVIRPASGIVGEVRALGGKVIGKDVRDRVYLAESMPALISGYAGIRDGLTAFLHVLKTMESDFACGTKADRTGAMEKTGAAMERYGPMAGKVGRNAANVLGLSFRMLQAEDDLFKTLMFRQELTALAVRQAYEMGFKGKAANYEAGRLITEPTDNMYNAAMQAAKRATFTNEDVGGMMGVLAQGIRSITAKRPELKFIAPFVTTPSNLVNYAIETSALAAISPRLIGQMRAGGAQADVAVAKVITGMAFTYAIYEAYQAGKITGSGPKDPNLRRLMEKTGYRPNAIQGKGGYLTYKRMDPFASSIAGLVNKLDQAKYSGREEDFRTLFMEGIFGIAEHALDSTYMKSAQDVLKLIDGNYDVNKFAANYASGFVPYTSLLKDVSQMVDPQQRRAFDDKEFQTGFSRQLDNKLNMIIPGRSKYLPPARHWDGSIKVPEMGQVASAIWPYKTSKGKPATRADAEMIRNGVSPSEPNPIITIGRGINAIHLSLLDLDNGAGLVYDAYIKKVGKYRKEALTELVEAGSDYYELSMGKGGERYNILSRVLKQAQNAAFEDFREDDLYRLMKGQPEDVKSIARKMAIDPEILMDMAESGNIEKKTGGRVKPGQGRGAKPLPLPPHANVTRRTRGNMPLM